VRNVILISGVMRDEGQGSLGNGPRFSVLRHPRTEIRIYRCKRIAQERTLAATFPMLLIVRFTENQVSIGQGIQSTLSDRRRMFSHILSEHSLRHLIYPVHPKLFGQVACSNLLHYLPQEVLLSVGKVIGHFHPPMLFSTQYCTAQGCLPTALALPTASTIMVA
jgi:hypothetical protein